MFLLKGERNMNTRQRRRVFEEAVSLMVSQAQLKQKRPDIFNEREMIVFEEKNTISCSSIIMSALGCSEQTKESDGNKVPWIVSDDDSDFSMDKSSFKALLEKIPKNGKIKNDLWKAFIKRNKTSLANLTAL